MEEEGVTEAEEATEVERAVAASGATGAVAASGTTAVAATAEESTGSLSPCKGNRKGFLLFLSPRRTCRLLPVLRNLALAILETSATYHDDFSPQGMSQRVVECPEMPLAQSVVVDKIAFQIVGTPVGGAQIRLFIVPTAGIALHVEGVLTFTKGAQPFLQLPQRQSVVRIFRLEHPDT